MEKLKELVERKGAKTRPANAGSIQALEAKLGFGLSQEYKLYLSTFGVIVHGASEIYGLGVPDNYYLNVGNAHADLSRDPAYPANAVPVIDVGDGQYYLYDNQAQQIILWATPNGGIVRKLDASFESFLIDQLFHGG
ncbi:SMI1/KNR4 family protein [Herbaspirillum sp. SJZ107]|uniref:SMI1/KNR4 family protein n=1 Tax=Herbaspirillum sp. SJZ107 TaxID=2572881 RepID=UPI00114F7B31|nr:SMI1/KNR4 family protein [Herbaspirillum sp. SJZ107]TQK03443.1 SUKH superfamily protein [Herbaspirillum sp. SJZ107]